MLQFKTGNLLESSCYVLVNTVNTVGVMGKGIALQFKNEFPHNFNVYYSACKSNKLQIGNLLPVKDHSVLLGERLIINFPTKTHWQLPSEYSYIERGLIAFAHFVKTERLTKIALPALGCGNGGLNWLIVKEIISEHLQEIDANFEIYTP